MTAHELTREADRILKGSPDPEYPVLDARKINRRRSHEVLEGDMDVYYRDWREGHGEARRGAEESERWNGSV